MLSFDADAVARALPYATLVDALAEAFAGEFEMPERVHHSLPAPGGRDGRLLLMPAWQPGRSLGVKIATVFPDNARRGIASVNASYLLLATDTGVPLAIMDGTELTLRRTAAASALASRYLSREDSATLLMVGTGSLAPHLVAAHRAVRPIEHVLVWGRDLARAKRRADRLDRDGVDITVVESLEACVPTADIVSCATMAEKPLIHGNWLRPGQHVDLVGAFRPDMREADHEALKRSRVYVDTRAGTFAEAGEIVQGLKTGEISEERVIAELAELARDRSRRRGANAEITLFKSVGCALEDLVAARLVLEQHEAG